MSPGILFLGPAGSGAWAPDPAGKCTDIPIPKKARPIRFLTNGEQIFLAPVRPCLYISARFSYYPQIVDPRPNPVEKPSYIRLLEDPAICIIMVSLQTSCYEKSYKQSSPGRKH